MTDKIGDRLTVLEKLGVNLLTMIRTRYGEANKKEGDKNSFAVTLQSMDTRPTLLNKSVRDNIDVAPSEVHTSALAWVGYLTMKITEVEACKAYLQALMTDLKRRNHKDVSKWNGEDVESLSTIDFAIVLAKTESSVLQSMLKDTQTVVTAASRKITVMVKTDQRH